MGLYEKITILLDYLQDIANKSNVHETDSIYKVSYKSNVDTFKTALDHPNMSVINEYQRNIRISFFYDNAPFTLEMFRSYDLENIQCQMDVFITKNNIVQNHFDYGIYFDTEKLSENILSGDTDLFGNSEQRKVIFLPLKQQFQNDYIYFVPISDIDNYYIDNELLIINQSSINKIKIIEEIFDDRVNPLTYYFKNRINDELLMNALNYKFLISVLQLLSNKVTNNGFVFKGYHHLEIGKSHYFKVLNPDKVLELLLFNMDEDKYNDKIEITRSVVTIYLSDEDNVEKFDRLLPKIIETIEIHFKAYINKQLDQFFDRRKEIVEEAHKAASTSREQTDKVISSINVTLIALITASLTSVFAYNRGDKFLFVIAIASHLIYFIISSIINYYSSKHKRNEIEVQFSNYCDEFAIIEQEQIDNIKDKYLLSSLNRLNGTLKLFKIITLLIIVLVFISLILVIYLYNPPTNNSNNVPSLIQIISNLLM